MQLIFKEQDEASIIGFIFDIFTRYDDSRLIDAIQIQEVIQVFAKEGGETPSGGIETPGELLEGDQKITK